MDVHISNFAGIESASFFDVRIALLGGNNGAGKSSVLQAVMATTANQPLIRNADKKKNARAVVRRGAKHAKVRILESGKWEVVLKWPDCEYSAEGPVPTAHPLGSGLRDFSSLDRKERSEVMNELLQSEPTIDDLARHMKEAGIKSEKTVAAVWDKIQAQGGDWDAALREISAKGADLKADWKAATGESYGRVKAEDWEPEGWGPRFADQTEESLQKKMQVAQDDVERAIGAMAVDQSRIDDLRTRIDDGKRAQEELGPAESAIASLEEELKTMTEEREPLHFPVTVGLPCPHCGKPVLIEKPQRHLTTLRKADEKMTPDDISALQTRIASLDGRISNVKGRISSEKADIRRIQERIGAAERAEEEVELSQRKDGSEETLKDARRRLTLARNDLTAFVGHTRAHTLHTKIKINAIVQDALGPTGVRETVLSDRLEVMNADLDELSRIAKHEPVRIDGQMEIWWGERIFSELSDGEQRRVQVIMQVAFARLTETPIITVDRFEVIEPQARGGLFTMFKQVGIPVFVALLTKDETTLPDLRKVKFGAVYWLNANEEIKEL